MKKVLLIAALLASTSAFATGNNNGDTTNNYDQRNYGGNTTNSGGAGGQGGQGGVGYGGNASAAAGAVAGAAAVNKNDISNTNLNANVSSNKNINSNSNKQGQQQGQAQGQQQSSNSVSGVKNSGNSSSSSGVLASGNSSSNSGGNVQSNAGNNATTSVSVAGDTYEAARIPVATAYAAPLAASNGTCLGSASGGLQFPMFGISGGKTTLDEGCDARYDAQALREIGLPTVAIARLCLKPEIAQAMAADGKVCPGAKKTEQAQSAQAAMNTIGGESGDASAQIASNTYDGPDPIIRARMHLPPLK